MTSSRLTFRITRGGDPHLARRARILATHPAIARLRGHDPRPIHRVALALVVQLAIGASLGVLARTWSPLAVTLVVSALAYAVGAPLAHYGGVVIHEASHDLCARGPTANRWVGVFANLVQGVPYAMSFRRHHATHHVHLGVVGIDNDLAQPVEIALVGTSAWRKLMWLALYPLVGGLLRGYLRRPDRWEVVNLLVVLGFDALVLWTLGPVALAYLLVSGLLSASLHPIAGHFIHEHYLWDEKQETYSYYGPLNAVTENMGYHVEHHDFPDVPGSRLPELHRIARQEYESLVHHGSWTAILWRFVTDATLSHASRFVRRRQDVRSGVNETVRSRP
jgi:sphingolipid delta-4 desaturase